MNKKIIVFGSFLAVFLMLMLPVNSAVEYQNQQETSINDLERENDGDCPLCASEEKMKNEYPELYDLLLKRMEILEDKIKLDGEIDFLLCIFCFTFFYAFPSVIVYYIVAIPFIILKIFVPELNIDIPVPCAEVCEGILF